MHIHPPYTTLAADRAALNCVTYCLRPNNDAAADFQRQHVVCLGRHLECHVLGVPNRLHPDRDLTGTHHLLRHRRHHMPRAVFPAGIEEHNVHRRPKTKGLIRFTKREQPGIPRDVPTTGFRPEPHLDSSLKRPFLPATGSTLLPDWHKTHRTQEKPRSLVLLRNILPGRAPTERPGEALLWPMDTVGVTGRCESRNHRHVAGAPANGVSTQYRAGYAGDREAAAICNVIADDPTAGERDRATNRAAGLGSSDAGGGYAGVHGSSAGDARSYRDGSTCTGAGGRCTGRSSSQAAGGSPANTPRSSAVPGTLRRPVSRGGLMLENSAYRSRPSRLAGRVRRRTLSSSSAHT